MRLMAFTIAVASLLCSQPALASPRPQQENDPRVSPSPVAVPGGTHFLIGLRDELRSGKDRANKRFEARTLEPLEASNGFIIQPGAKIRGHISRIEPGSVTGRARIWLTFDEIETRRGHLPIVAIVSGVPGDFSVRPQSKEGEIEARSGDRNASLQAAATGAAMGAAAASRHSAKGTAMGALEGGAAGFLASSGIGQELDLLKGTKIDLVLDRPLYID
jgi:hypothetical protein